jgi:nucleotide-binding universal stress UspA family protein
MSPAVAFPEHFARILTVQDPNSSDTGTLALAAGLADAMAAELTALAVVEPPPGVQYVSYLAHLSQAEIERRLRASGDSALARALDSAGLSQRARRRIGVGKTFVETVRTVIEGGHDLVIKTAEELEGADHGLLASTDQHLLRKCPCPVWLRRAGGAGRPTRVLAAIDVDTMAASEPATQEALNRRVLRLAATIAGWAEAELHAVNVWSAPAESLVRSFSGWDQGSDYVKEVEAQHWSWLTGTIDAAFDDADPEADSTPVPQPQLVRGRPRQAIPELVRTLGADLLIMGTVARTGVPGLIIGNTAEDVFNGVDVPLVAVKPPGYVSPLAAGLHGE